METLKRWFQKKSEESLPTPGQPVNLRRIMPYGDQMNDGAMQLSFTLPVDHSPEAKEAARLYVEKLGFHEIHVANAEAIGAGFTYFVVFARAKHAIDFTKVKVAKADFQKLDFDQVMKLADEKLKRRLVVIGATTGTDAHTVGLDAIMNMKGYAGDPGLERYPCFKVVNLRSQVDNKELVEAALELKADVILISKLVTQRGQHLQDLKDLLPLLKENKKLNQPLLKIVGGPRMTHAIAVKLGYDAGFGPGTLPSEVASFIVHEYSKKAK
ncbi:MAG: cobalamin-dependent protein [Deltaproteobacteria bacterium]|nr:cobalamin-dependent protein [Deltaproteobacteria bacterium]